MDGPGSLAGIPFQPGGLEALAERGDSFGIGVAAPGIAPFLAFDGIPEHLLRDLGAPSQTREIVQSSEFVDWTFAKRFVKNHLVVGIAFERGQGDLETFAVFKTAMSPVVGC